MKYYIHVNQHIIRKNIGATEKEPPVAVRRGKTGGVQYGMAFRIPGGSVIRYSPDVPILSCGARLVIECDSEPEIIS